MRTTTSLSKTLVFILVLLSVPLFYKAQDNENDVNDVDADGENHADDEAEEVNDAHRVNLNDLEVTDLINYLSLLSKIEEENGDFFIHTILQKIDVSQYPDLEPETLEEKHCLCPELFEPVCCDNGVLFANKCVTDCVDGIILHEGRCGNTRSCFCYGKNEPVCGKDHITYKNDCFLHCVGVDKAHDGECIEEVDNDVNNDTDNDVENDEDDDEPLFPSNGNQS